MTLEKNFEVAGLWWLPGEEENRICGTLTFSRDEGGVLSLIGAFGDITQLMETGPRIIIHGLSKDGKEFTLLDCWRKGSQVGGIYCETYFTYMAVEGAYFDSSEGLTFDAATVRYPLLEDWLQEQGLMATIEQEEATRRISGTAIGCTFPAAKIFRFGNFSLSFNYRYQTSFLLRRATLIYSQVALFEYTEKRDLETILEDVTKLRNFLSLALNKPIYPETITVTSSDLKEFLGDKERLLPIRIHFMSATTDVPEGNLTPWEPLFFFVDIQDRFPVVYQRWLALYDDLLPAIHSTFAALAGGKEYKIDRLLSLTQAVESLHRRLFDGRYLSDEAFDEIKTTLMAALPSDLDSDARESFVRKIGFMNEFSQRKRVKDLVRRIETDFGTQSMDTLENRRMFIDKLSATRNYYTHFTAELYAEAYHGLGVIVLIEKLRFLLDMSFLWLLEFSADDVRRILGNTNKYRMLSYYRGRPLD
ncbi:MAG TPA: hypothetical protein DCR97_00095 [Deltaproteobacteria bacterium]|nr:hypothetical protein [Deltaproteobacteria bacterium]